MDYTDFYHQSIASGAKPDEFGGVYHNAASLETMRMNQENAAYANNAYMNIKPLYGTNNQNAFMKGNQQASARNMVKDDFRPPVNRSFWSWLFND